MARMLLILAPPVVVVLLLAASSSATAYGDQSSPEEALLLLQAPPPLVQQDGSSTSETVCKKGGNYKGMSREFVDGHNEVRARYGAPPLEWDNKLALYARRWAKAMSKECLPKHSSGMYAETIYLGRNGCNATAKDALFMWEAEEPIYDKATGNCSHGHLFNECGHFAIMVNKHYLWLGCGRAECDGGRGVFISCNYYFTRPHSSSSSSS